MNKVSIVIVTYNGLEWIEECLGSCKGYSVIVVDNGSADETCAFIENHFPQVTLLKQKENKGFGQANNIGISHALNHGAEHILLLNQDAYLIGTSLTELFNFQKNNTEYGIISPLHITADQLKLDKNFSNYMLKEETGEFYSDFVLNNEIKDIYQVPFVNAAAWLVSKYCLETVGGFDPLFFHYGEDRNYCQRVLFHGLKIGVLPKAYVVHDRDGRKKSKLVEFSDSYYENRLRAFKIRQADILRLESINKVVSKLNKMVFRLYLLGKFKRAFGHKKELILKKQIKHEILKSREINKKKGKHYLT